MSLLSARVPLNTYIPNPRYPPSSSSIVSSLGEYASYLQHVFRAAPKTGNERTDGRKGQGGKKMEQERERESSRRWVGSRNRVVEPDGQIGR
eukprot:2315425-Pyramimonas_sp.AAC.1